MQKNQRNREFETYKINIAERWEVKYVDVLIKEEPRVTQSAIGFNRDSSYAKLNITSYYATPQIQSDMIKSWRISNNMNIDSIRVSNFSAFLVEKDLKVLDDVKKDTLTYFNSEWLLIGKQYVYKLSYGSYNKRLKEDKKK